MVESCLLDYLEPISKNEKEAERARYRSEPNHRYYSFSSFSTQYVHLQK